MANIRGHCVYDVPPPRAYDQDVEAETLLLAVADMLRGGPYHVEFPPASRPAATFDVHVPLVAGGEMRVTVGCSREPGLSLIQLEASTPVRPGVEPVRVAAALALAYQTLPEEYPDRIILQLPDDTAPFLPTAIVWRAHPTAYPLTKDLLYALIERAAWTMQMCHALNALALPPEDDTDDEVPAYVLQ